MAGVGGREDTTVVFLRLFSAGRRRQVLGMRHAQGHCMNKLLSHNLVPL